MVAVRAAVVRPSGKLGLTDVPLPEPGLGGVAGRRDERIDRAVLDAVSGLLREAGYPALTLEAVATRAGYHQTRHPPPVAEPAAAGGRGEGA